MKGPKSPNQPFVAVQKDILSLSVQQQIHVHLDEFCQPPKEKTASIINQEQPERPTMQNGKRYKKKGKIYLFPPVYMSEIVCFARSILFSSFILNL